MIHERRLIQRAQSGDAVACARIVTIHYAAIYRLLVHLTRGDTHRAEDLCQETFTAAWIKLATFAGDSSLGTWLHQIAYRRFLDSLRGSELKLRDRELPLMEAHAPIDSRNPLDGAVASEQTERLYAAMDQLDAADRDLLAMHYLEGLSYHQIAQITAEPTGTIKWRVNGAIECLRKILNKDVEADDDVETTKQESNSRSRASQSPRSDPPAAPRAIAFRPAGA